MKFRKLKLAALLATAVLTAGTMSLATYAADDEVVIDNDGGQNETMPVLTSEIDGATPVVAADPNKSALRYAEGSIKYVYDGAIDPTTGKPTENDKMSATYWAASEAVIGDYNKMTDTERQKFLEGLEKNDAETNAKEGWYYEKAENVKFYAIGEVNGVPQPALCSNIKASEEEAEGYIVLSADIYDNFEKITRRSENILVKAKHEKQQKWIEINPNDPGDYAPTCDKDGNGTLHWKCKYCGAEGVDVDSTIAALGHDWQQASFLNDGTANVLEEVTVAEIFSEGHDGNPDVTIDYTVKNDNLKVDSNNRIVCKNGVPELDDPTKDGVYYTVVYCSRECVDAGDDTFTHGEGEDAITFGCTEGGHRKVKSIERHLILAQKASYAVITAVKGVVDEAHSTSDAKTLEDMMADPKAPVDGSPKYTTEELYEFELVHCNDETAKYTVTYFNSGDKPIGYADFAIPPHHILEERTEIEFASEADKNQCNVTPYNNNTKKWEVTNKSCVLDVEYFEVQHCAAAGCNLVSCVDVKPGRVVWDTTYNRQNKHEYSVEKKKAEFGGVHSIDKEARATIQKLLPMLSWNDVYDEANEWNFLYDKKAYNNTLEDYLAGKGDLAGKGEGNNKKHPSVSLVKLSDSCEEGGEIRIEYHCTLCGELITSTEFYVLPDHFAMPAKMKTIEEPTCTKEGKGQAVMPCARADCNGDDHTAKEDRIVNLPVVPHTNQINDKLADGDYDDDYLNVNKEEVKLDIIGKIVVDIKGTLLKTKDYGKYLEAVQEDGTAADYILAVDGRAYTICDNCKGHPVTVGMPVLVSNRTADDKKNKKTILIELVEGSLKTQNVNIPCQPGSVTLVFKSYNEADKKYVQIGDPVEFAYYADAKSYAARGDHRFGPEYRVTVEEATETTEGKVEVRRKCEICGTEDTIKIETIPAKGPAPVEPTKLPAVQNVNAEVVGNGEVKVTWNAVEGADGYFITAYNKISQGATVKKITSGTVTEWTDTNAKTDDYSVYWVTAYKNEADGSVTKGELIMDDGYDWAIAIQLSKVSGLQANGVKGGITLSWNAVKGANSYMLLAKDGGKGDYVVQQMVYATTYMDTTATVDSVRSYWVIPAYERTNGKRLAVGPTSDYVADRALAK